MMTGLGAEWIAAMRRGDDVAARRISMLVLAARDPASRDDPSLPYHLRWVWDGRPFEGRHVLVRSYHGLGDTVQFARYLPLLQSIAASVTVEAQPELLPLLGAVPGIDRLIPFIHEAPAPPSECDIEIMELPFALDVPPWAIPPCPPRVPIAPLPAGTVGLCWQAGNWDSDRSIPPDLIKPFTARPCITLQPSPTELDVLNRGGCPADIAGTAALIAGLDLVITVDTMIAHLAGTLGRPTWLLLKRDADWRWMADRGDSPWYPSMRLYRQPAAGDWPSVIVEVTNALTKRSATTPPPGPR